MACAMREIFSLILLPCGYAEANVSPTRNTQPNPPPLLNKSRRVSGFSLCRIAHAYCVPPAATTLGVILKHGMHGCPWNGWRKTAEKAQARVHEVWEMYETVYKATLLIEELNSN